MTTFDLAHALRYRQYTLGTVPWEQLEAMRDDQVIDAYVTCSCCGRRQVTLHYLDKAITQAVDVEQFFDLCEFYSTKVT